MLTRSTLAEVACKASGFGAPFLSSTDNHLAGLGAMAELPSTLRKGKPGYEGVLSPEIVTFPELLAGRAEAPALPIVRKLMKEYLHD